MSKYIKLEDAIRKYAEMIADEAYWEHGVGNGKPDEEDLDIAREYYSDLPTIEVSEDCIERDLIINQLLNLMSVEKEHYEGMDKALKLIEQAPNVTTEESSMVGEWIVADDESVLFTVYKCSRCGKVHAHSPHNYCPNCGAKMKGADDEM